MLRWLGLSDQPLLVFLTLTFAGFTFFLALAGVSYGVFFVWKRDKFHPHYKANRDEIRKSLRWSFYSIAGNAVLMMPVHWAIAHGHSKVYLSVAEHGWLWMGSSIVLILVISETGTYWIHRALHSRYLFAWLHKPHHSFRVPTPWAGVAFHPLDSYAQALPHHLCIFLFPVHLGVYTVFISFLTVWAVMIHDRLSFMPWSGINYTGHHTLHHWYYRYNYGQFFTVWDRLGGTYKNPEAMRGKVPEDVLRPHQLQGWIARHSSPPVVEPTTVAAQH